jgi:hypothetical protein
MKKSTFRFIIILVGLLFINIEAAHAGLVHKIKIYINHEFSDFPIVYFMIGLLILSFLSYVIFSPILIGKERWAWFSYYSYNPNRHDYQSKRDMVKKISGILKNEEFGNQAHS